MVLGWFVHARSMPAERTSGADRALLAVAGPVQHMASGMVRAGGAVVSSYVGLIGVGDRVAALEEQLAWAEASSVELGELRLENDRLRALVGLRARSPYQTLPATVIGRGTSSRFQTIRIDRGEEDGVRVGQAVLALGGTVGRVLRSSRRFSDVLLVTDGLSGIGAAVVRSRLRGVASGDGSERLSMGLVRRSDQEGILLGDHVVTSGDDGVFPEGVSIGRVSQASSPETGLFLEVSLAPSVDLQRLEEVLVVAESGSGPFSYAVAPVPEGTTEEPENTPFHNGAAAVGGRPL